ncbi:MAG: hypothetical protein QM736_05275 [Vicinamibacterales bacterium]
MFTANARRFVLVERLQTAVCEATVRLFRFVDDRPRLMRVIVHALAVKPVWRFGTTALVTGDRQVREVLERDHDFPLMDDREPKFLTGAFLLGMNRTPQHARERGLLEAAILRTDVSAVAALVRTTSQQQVDAARSIGHIDVVRQLSNPVGEMLLRDYFGVSTANDVADDLRILGAMIASPRAMLPAFRNRAASAADRIVTSIASDIRIARAAAVSAQRRDTVLQRMADAAGRTGVSDETGTARFDRRAAPRECARDAGIRHGARAAVSRSSSARGGTRVGRQPRSTRPLHARSDAAASGVPDSAALQSARDRTAGDAVRVSDSGRVQRARSGGPRDVRLTQPALCGCRQRSVTRAAPDRAGALSAFRRRSTQVPRALHRAAGAGRHAGGDPLAAESARRTHLLSHGRRHHSS